MSLSNIKSKALHLVTTIEKEIIDNEELQKDWFFKNEESLVEEYVMDRLIGMKDDEFDNIVAKRVIDGVEG